MEAATTSIGDGADLALRVQVLAVLEELCRDLDVARRPRMERRIDGRPFLALPGRRDAARRTSASHDRDRSLSYRAHVVAREAASARSSTCTTGRSTLVKNVNLAIPERRVTALIGPSGCGKSTFIRTLNRMHDLTPAPASSEKCFWTKRIFTTKASIRSRSGTRVGMVFQRPEPVSASRSSTTSPTGARLQGERRPAVLREICERSLTHAALWNEVKDRLDRSALDLSGGQQQRLCIARCLAVDPEIILMDRACLGARSDRDQQDRGPDPRPQRALYRRHRHPFHAASRAHQRLHGVLLTGRDGRNGHDVRDLHQAARSPYRGLHHRTLRLVPPPPVRTSMFATSLNVAITMS